MNGCLILLIQRAVNNKVLRARYVAIDFNVVCNYSRDNMGIDHIECVSSSFGIRGFEEENNDSTKLSKSIEIYSVSISTFVVLLLCI